MIFVINTSSSGIEFLLDGKYKRIDAEKQSLALPTEAEKFLHENGVTWKDLTAIGVVVGPGSFTGIRLGIAYAKGLSIGLKIPVVAVNAFEIYLEHSPDAFVAIDSGRNDLFVGAKDLVPCTMDIAEIETKQMTYLQTVGHKPFDLTDVLPVIKRKLDAGNLEPVVPMYLRPSYAEIQKCCKN